MRLYRPILLLIAIHVLAPARAAEPATVLTLEEALASVEKVNLNVLLSREATVQAVEQARIARSSILPVVNASASQRRSRGVSITNGVASRGSASSRFDAQLTGSYALLDPQAWIAARAEGVGIEIARADYAAAVQEVLSDVAGIYFSHLRNLRRLDVLDNNIARARTLLELARNQLAAGTATQIDVTRADAQLALAEQARLQQLTTGFQSELLLKLALDINPAQSLRLEDFTVRRTDTALITLGDDKETLGRRAEYQRAQKAVDQAKLDVKAATFERLPALTLTGQYGVGAENFDDSSADAWSAGIGLNLPVFDGFRIGANRRSALSRQRSQEIRLRNVELQISSEIRLAAQDASSRNAQVTVAEKGLQLADEELRLAEQRYRQGVADNREVVDAQNRRAVAADNFVEAVFQYNLSRVELARAKGDVRSVLTEKGP